ncbi:MAG: ABC transporter permease [Dehalococcoidia bacterium]|jgi:peptide/nickel transport system permease protein|uniref:ABC transporter permease n=1 Tax=Candidatus Amarobacter glycogenicus TaxID=3140699 RepID=UPI003135E564|nr:ABC transporter permease [Dehalococcoidia bacterium]MBK6563396.1 ABC transporter permease [Dehalococcoidia bacterium]MBK7329087.1 ABC transporter permease [Dehalococcoidia bacterium]MBK8560183.1 ABC transporter permease [Dehalococcoidia bacterium]MBK9342082.1 ABC transporter permease [Dehalococcoidia bacterium]
MAEAAAGQVSLGRPASNSALVRLVGFFRTLAKRKPLGFVSFLILVFLFVVALFPQLFATHGPADTGVGERLQNYCLGPKDTFLCPTKVETSQITGNRTVEGSLSSPFGTDQLQRDVYSRLVYGARWAIYIGLIAVAISSSISLLIGVTCGYFGGKYDAVVQRFVDAIMALPALVVLLALPQMIGRWDLDGPLPLDDSQITFFKLALVLGFLGGAGGSRVIRSSVLGVRAAQYLEAARVIGCTDRRIMLRHVIPNIFGPLIVQATIGLGGIILAEAALSFLGFGVVDPNKPTWGQMLNLGNLISSVHVQSVVWPGVCIALAVFSFNMLGDALRDLLDPRLRGAGGGFG